MLSHSSWHASASNWHSFLIDGTLLVDNQTDNAYELQAGHAREEECTLVRNQTHWHEKSLKRGVYQRTPADILTYYRNSVAFEDSSLCSHTSDIFFNLFKGQAFKHSWIKLVCCKWCACAQMYAYSSWIASFYSVTSCVVLPFPVTAVICIARLFVTYVTRFRSVTIGTCPLSVWLRLLNDGRLSSYTHIDAGTG